MRQLIWFGISTHEPAMYVVKASKHLPYRNVASMRLCTAEPTAGTFDTTAQHHYWCSPRWGLEGPADLAGQCRTTRSNQPCSGPMVRPLLVDPLCLHVCMPTARILLLGASACQQVDGVHLDRTLKHIINLTSLTESLLTR
jgi:hypothetical protein